MRVAWTTPALRQLEDIQDYIARDDPRAAYEVAALIRDRVNVRLPENPSMGRPGRVAGTRELVVSNVPYVVAYRLQGDDIQVLAVKHGARKWPKAF